MLLEMRGAPAVALTGVGTQRMRVAGGTNNVEKIGPLAGVWQRNRRGRFAVLQVGFGCVLS